MSAREPDGVDFAFACAIGLIIVIGVALLRWELVDRFSAEVVQRLSVPSILRWGR